MCRTRDYLQEEADRIAQAVGIPVQPRQPKRIKRKVTKLPTPEELEFYRNKSLTGSFIGKNQLAAVFAALDHEKNQRAAVFAALDHATARAESAEARLAQADKLLFMAETTFGPRTTPGPERVCAARALMHALREAGYKVDPA